MGIWRFQTKPKRTTSSIASPYFLQHYVTHRRGEPPAMRPSATFLIRMLILVALNMFYSELKTVSIHGPALAIITVLCIMVGLRFVRNAPQRAYDCSSTRKPCNCTERGLCSVVKK